MRGFGRTTVPLAFRRVFVGSVAVIVALAACGDGDDDAASVTSVAADTGGASSTAPAETAAVASTAASGSSDETSIAPPGTTAPASTAPAELRTVRFGYAESLNSGAPSVTYLGGFGADCGVRFDRWINESGGTTNQIAALLSGDLDVAFAGTNGAMDPIAQGAELQIIGAQLGTLLNTVTLTTEAAEASGVSPDAPVEDRLLALRGLTIASPTPGSAGLAALEFMLRSVGLDPERDVTLVPIDANSSVPAGLAQGVYDAAFVGADFGALAIQEGSAVNWISVPQGDVPELAGYQAGVAVARTDWVNENPDVAKCVHKAMVDAAEFIRDDPAAAGQMLFENVFAGIDPELWAATWDEVKGAFGDGVFSRENLAVFVQLFDESSESDYASIDYDSIVPDFARA